MFLDTGLGNYFLVVSPKVQATKANIDKWDYIILKKFCLAKNNQVNENTTYRMKVDI